MGDHCAIFVSCGIDWELDDGNIPFASRCKRCDHDYGINWHSDKRWMSRIIDINTYNKRGIELGESSQMLMLRYLDMNWVKTIMNIIASK